MVLRSLEDNRGKTLFLKTTVCSVSVDQWVSQSLLFLILTLINKLVNSLKVDSLIRELSFPHVPVSSLGQDRIEQKA